MGVRTNLAAAGVLGACMAFPGTAGLTNTAGPVLPDAVKLVLPVVGDLVSVDVEAVDDYSNPQIGDVLHKTPVIATFAANGGGWDVDVDPASVPASAIDAEGVVDLDIAVSTATQTWRTSVSSRIVNNALTGRREWVDPLAPLPAGTDLLGGIAQLLTLVDLRVPLLDLGAEPAPDGETDDVVGEEFPATTLDSELPTNIGSVELSHYCGETTYRGDSNRSTTIATSYPLGNSTSWLDIDRSSGGNFGIAVTGGDGKFRASGTRYAGGGWGATWAPSSKMRSYRIKTNYHHWLDSCGAGNWSPHIETGEATANYSGLTRPGWNTYCAKVDNLMDWTRKDSTGSNYSAGGAVKFKDVIGIDLSGEHSYSASQVLHYKIAGTNKKLCGNGEYPAKAGKIVERYR